MMKTKVTNIIKVIGRIEDIKKTIMMLCSCCDDNSVVRAISNSLEYKLDDNLCNVIKWGDNDKLFDISLVSSYIVKFKTYNDTPYDALLELSEYNPYVYISVQYADEELGYHTGIYKFFNGEELDYYAPNYGTSEAAELSLSVNDDEYYIYDHICDLEDDELEDGINGSDEVLNTLIKHIYKNKILSDIYPIRLQEYLIELSVSDEDYEYASEIKKVINS